ncbi:hypothetical protein RvY_00537 [Ramazzottius varieornatus]|uniref:Uncharacterized protein n=1 Tax=Ramazzottius varieornatus TaxID=947166 RepID=A0A1D1UE22_RAMVA|nr:hypothetical protein RvY_00537 [Ramazzottius varieornatus]
MFCYLTELTTGDVEKNLLIWASTRPNHLRALCSVGPSEELKKANQSSFSLMAI